MKKLRRLLFKWHLMRIQKLCEKHTLGEGCPYNEGDCTQCDIAEWKNGSTRYPYEYDELWRK
jgi:hypothetical protein